MILIYVGSLWKIFERVGRKKWEGFVPVYNVYVWLKIINKPWWWIFFFIIPFVNLVVAVGCNVETAILFGRYSVKDTLLMVLVPWYYIPYIAFNKNLALEKETDWTKKEERSKRFLHDHLTLFFIAPVVGHALYVVFRVLGSKDKANKKTMTCEWTNALGFAIVAASIIRSLFFEAFTIPTGSMEKTMRVGDYLFVNKMKYGAKLPQTPISIPFVHNRIPGTFIPSFVEWFKMDYLRLPGYGSIKRGDIMVFNWPVGDSVIVHDGVIAHDYYAILRNEAYLNCTKDLLMLKMYNSDNPKNKILNLESFLNKKDSNKIITLQYVNVVNQNINRFGVNLSADKYNNYRYLYMNSTRSNLINGGGLSQSPAGPIAKTGGIATLPIDKKENYIKRCVGVGGDTLEVINNTIHINGVPEERGDEVVFTYDFYFKPGYGIPHDQVAEKFEIYRDQHLPYFTADGRTQWNNPKKKIILVADTSFTEDSLPNVKEILVNYNHERITCSPQTYEILKRFSGIDSSSQEIQQKGFDYSIYAQFSPYYPNEPSFNWSRDNYGPLYIPKSGREIELTENNWILYRRVIEVYEGNNVLIKDGNIYINNELSSHYTFKQNYYWLMGDNRHGSADSRCWGFVPEDHVVGTASFVWFSKHAETGIRWDRIFSFVK